MTEKIDFEIVKILDLILQEGFAASESDLLSTFGKQRKVEKFARAFSEAVRNIFSENLMDMLCKNKMPDHLVKEKYPSGYPNLGIPADFVKHERLRAKLHEMETLLLQINEESEKLSVEKQRLQFYISSINENKSELDIAVQNLLADFRELDFLKYLVASLNP